MKLYQENITEFGLKQAQQILSDYYGVEVDQPVESHQDLLDIADEQYIWIPKNQIDDLLESIYNGNWDAAVKEMLRDGITPEKVAAYAEDNRDDSFGLGQAVALARIYYGMR